MIEEKEFCFTDNRCGIESVGCEVSSVCFI